MVIKNSNFFMLIFAIKQYILLSLLLFRNQNFKKISLISWGHALIVWPPVYKWLQTNFSNWRRYSSNISPSHYHALIFIVWDAPDCSRVKGPNVQPWAGWPRIVLHCCKIDPLSLAMHLYVFLFCYCLLATWHCNQTKFNCKATFCYAIDQTLIAIH